MKPLPEGRGTVEQRLRSEARKVWSEMVRQERRAEAASAIAEECRHDLQRMRDKAAARFGCDIPPNAALFDVLELIEVEPDGRWLWRGLRNNKGLATIRYERGEVSVVRFLAVQLGIIGEDEWGSFYPIDGDTADVNPHHKTFRPSPTPTGNPKRFTFDAEPA